MGYRDTQLLVDERRRIEPWRAVRVSPAEMARVLGLHRSTIFRQLRRNHLQDRDFPKVAGHFAMAAQRQTSELVVLTQNVRNLGPMGVAVVDALMNLPS